MGYAEEPVPGPQDFLKKNQSTTKKPAPQTRKSRFLKESLVQVTHPPFVYCSSQRHFRW